MSQNPSSATTVIGIDIGKNSFHVVGLDDRGAIILRQKWSRGQIEARLANMPPCLIGMEACVARRQVRRAAAGGAARRLKVKERGVGCDAFCSKQVSKRTRYRHSFQLLIEIGIHAKGR